MATPPANSGASLIGVLVALGIAGFAALVFTSLFSSQMKAQDSLRLTAQLDELRWTTRLITQRSGSCAKSGLVGRTVDPANPGATVIELALPGDAGPGGPFLREGLTVPGTKWRTQSLRLTSVANVGGGAYFSTLRARLDYRPDSGSSQSASQVTSRSTTVDLHLMLTLNPAGVVTACGGLGPTSVFRASLAATQAIPTGVETIVRWSRRDLDALGEINLANGRFTPTTPGLYRLTAQLQAGPFIPTDSTGPDQFGIYLYKNGVREAESGFLVSATGWNWLTARIEAVVTANGTTDTFDIRAWHDDTSARQANPTQTVSYFTGHLLTSP